MKHFKVEKLITIIKLITIVYVSSCLFDSLDVIPL